MRDADAGTGIAIDVPDPLAALASHLRIAEDEMLHLVLALVRRARDALTSSGAR